MSFSGPVGLATREPLHGRNTVPVHCHPPMYVIMWWRGTALPFNGPASQPAGRRLWGLLLLPEMPNLSLPHPKGLIRVGLQMGQCSRLEGNPNFGCARPNASEPSGPPPISEVHRRSSSRMGMKFLPRRFSAPVAREGVYLSAPPREQSA